MFVPFLIMLREGLEAALIGLPDVVIRQRADRGEVLVGGAIATLLCRRVIDERVAGVHTCERGAFAVVDLGDAEFNPAAHMSSRDNSEPAASHAASR